MTNQDSNPTTNHSRSATVCGQCGIDEPKLLHNVRHRGNFRRLCTSCVLRLHPHCFCPACLGVFDRSPPIDAFVCYKCYSSSHPTCISSSPAGTIASSRCASPCPACLNPNLLVLNLNRLENGSRIRAIDVNAAKLLLAAAKIAAISMNKAEVAAAMEAERRSKEAAYTKKRAKEALDHVVRLMSKKNRNVNTSAVVVRPVATAVAAVMDSNAVSNKINDDSSEVLEALNAVELKESGLQVPRVSVGSGEGNGAVVMEVDVVNGKDSGVDSVVENGSVKSDDLVKIAQNGPEQVPEKIIAVVETSVSYTKN